MNEPNGDLMNTQLNENEQTTLELLKQYGYEPCDALDRSETTQLISKESGMSKHEVAGYLSSLVKKGLAESFEMEVNGSYPRFICVK